MKRIIIGIVLMACGVLSSVLFYFSLQVLMGIGHLVTVAGLILLIRGISGCKEGAVSGVKSNTKGKSEDSFCLCVLCNKDLSKFKENEIKYVDGERYCIFCANILEKAIQNMHQRCMECGAEMPLESMHVLDDKVYCRRCFSKKYETIEHDVNKLTKISMMEQIKNLLTSNGNFDGDSYSLDQDIFVPLFLPTHSPLCYIDSFVLFTSREHAQNALDENIKSITLYNHLFIKKIDSRDIKAFLGECYASGFKNFIINRKEKIPFIKCSQFMQDADSDLISPEICNKMLFYKETIAILQWEGEKTENNSKLAALSKEIIQSLADETLFILDSENIVVDFMQEKLIVAFTDSYAFNRYYSNEPFRLVSDLLTNSDRLKKYGEISGVVINPGREEFVIRRSK